MKNFKKLKVSVLCAIIMTAMLTLSGCNGFLNDPVSLMQPPGAGGDLEGIEAALSRIDDEYELSYPSGGEYRNAILIKDIDGDEQNEAVVFYQITKDNVTAIHLNILSKVDEEWKSNCDVALPGVGVDRIEFTDICGDDKAEVLVGNKMYNTNEQELDIFKYENSELTMLAQEKYTDYITCNLGASPKSQILYFNITNQAVNSSDDSSKSTVLQNVSAKLVSFSYEKDGVSTSLGTVKFDGGITSFSQIMPSPITDSKNGVFVDAYKGTLGMITEVFYYDKTLKTTFYNTVDNSTETTAREQFVNCFDINNDGRLEIPRSYICHGYENVTEADQKAYFTEWYSLGDTALESKVATGVLNVTDGYFLNIPDNLLGAVTVERNYDERSRVFYDWNFDTSAKGDELFSIRVFLRTAFEKNSDGFTKITSDSEYIYAVKINIDNQSENKLTIDYLKDNITLLNK